MTRYQLEGKSILITGGATGIGLSTARIAAASGARITIAGRDRGRGDAAVAEIVGAGGIAQYVPVDISDESSVESMVASVLQTYGKLDAAFNNGGVPAAPNLLHLTTTEEYRRLTGVILDGAFFCLKYEVNAMLDTGGSILYTTSGGATSIVEQLGIYAVAKAGMNAIVRQAAKDYGNKGIRVNAVVPGVTRTPMTEQALLTYPGLVETLSEQHPLGRIGEADEVAHGAAWLLSDDASFVTGAFLTVDGGFTL